MKPMIMTFGWLCSGLAVAAMDNQQRPEDERMPEQYYAECAAGISSSSCGRAPVAVDCLAGKHWTLIGLGYAHCVTNDMTCPMDTELIHDQFGNPGCQKFLCLEGSYANGSFCSQKLKPYQELNGLRIPDYDKEPYSYWGLGNRDSTYSHISSAQLILSYSTIDGRWMISTNGIWSDYMTPKSYWKQKGSIDGIWTRNLALSYSFIVTDVYGKNLTGPGGISGPQPLPANTQTPLWSCTGGAINMPGGVENYQPVLIKVWADKFPDTVVTARFNCQASGAFMQPFTIDSRGYPEGTKNEYQLP